MVLFVFQSFTKENLQTWSNLPLATFGSERVKCATEQIDHVPHQFLFHFALIYRLF